MPSLRDVQRGFCAATIFGDDTAVAGLGVAAGALGVAARIDIYRNNVLGNYRKVLGAAFPVVKRLVGAAFFHAAVDAFVRAHPSVRGDVNGYGADLARFLESYGPARPLAYLPDVARLEWAIDQAAIAADASALDLAALAAVDQDALAMLRFRLHPSVRLIESRYPLLHIWQANQPDRDGSDEIDLGEGGDSLLVARAERAVGIERLTPGEAQLLRALAANAALGAAAARAGAVNPSFDLPAVLQRHVLNRVVVAFAAPRAPRVGRKRIQ